MRELGKGMKEGKRKGGRKTKENERFKEGGNS